MATPPLADPNFDRTVVYMLEHTDDGAVGVVLEPTAARAAPRATRSRGHGLLSTPATLHHGGPVDESALIALARLDGPIEGAWSPVADGMGSIDLLLDPDAVARNVTALRVFQGYSGWAPAAAGRGTSGGCVDGADSPSPPTYSARRPSRCGAMCCAAKVADSHGWPTLPTT